MTIALENFQFPQRFLSFYSLSQKRLLTPSNIQHSPESNSVLIAFDQAALSLSGDNVLCALNVPDSRRRKRNSLGSMMQCGERININVTGIIFVIDFFYDY